MDDVISVRGLLANCRGAIYDAPESAARYLHAAYSTYLSTICPNHSEIDNLGVYAALAHYQFPDRLSKPAANNMVQWAQQLNALKQGVADTNTLLQLCAFLEGLAC